MFAFQLLISNNLQVAVTKTFRTLVLSTLRRLGQTNDVRMYIQYVCKKSLEPLPTCGATVNTYGDVGISANLPLRPCRGSAERNLAPQGFTYTGEGNLGLGGYRHKIVLTMSSTKLSTALAHKASGVLFYVSCLHSLLEDALSFMARWLDPPSLLG